MINSSSVRGLEKWLLFGAAICNKSLINGSSRESAVSRESAASRESRETVGLYLVTRLLREIDSGFKSGALKSSI